MMSATALQTDQSSDNLEVTTGQLVVKITGGGNVPRYQFWDRNANSTRYDIQFSQVFEAKDNPGKGTQNAYDLGTDTKVPGQTLALSKLKWNFSDVIQETNGNTHFNLTSSDGTFQFRNHLYANQANALKFDLVINNYQFQASDSMLVLAFKFQGTPAVSQPLPNGSNSQVSFGNGYFSTSKSAMVGNKSLSVGLSTSSAGSSMIYLAYQHFNGKTMIHDPSIGISGMTTHSSSQGNTDTTQTTNSSSQSRSQIWQVAISPVTIGVSSFLATILAILVPLTLYQRNK